MDRSTNPRPSASLRWNLTEDDRLSLSGHQPQAGRSGTGGQSLPQVKQVGAFIVGGGVVEACKVDDPTGGSVPQHIRLGWIQNHRSRTPSFECGRESDSVALAAG